MAMFMEVERSTVKGLLLRVMMLALLKRTGVLLKRDIIFLGTADEEAGGSQGAGWFVESL